MQVIRASDFRDDAKRTVGGRLEKIGEVQGVCVTFADIVQFIGQPGKSICEVSRIYSHSGESSLTEPIRICSAVLVGFLHGKRTLTVDFFHLFCEA